jgi:RimJ/RimL family protein N-acetyltransferase
MWELFSDLSLHEFTPYEPLSLEKQRERCTAWEKSRSPDGKELWLNWAARDRLSNKVMAHFQVGVGGDSVATAGYLVAKSSQRQGYAYEGLRAIFDYLKNDLKVLEMKAWTDSRNIASHALAQKLGMSKVEVIPNADFFKGSTSDEFVFSVKF